MCSREVHVFIHKAESGGKRKNGSDNDDKNTLIMIMFKVNEGTTEPTVLQCCIKFWHGPGQTGRSLDHQLQEHRSALKNGDVAEHPFSCNHKVDRSKASVIDAHPTLRHSAC